MEKNEYRIFFAECMKMLKMKYYLNVAKISPVTFSRFMKGPDFDWCLSVEKLQYLQDVISSELAKIR